MIELKYASAKDKRIHDCSVCHHSQQSIRKCSTVGFNNTKGKGWRVDERGLYYKFCPGKATWYREIVEVFEQCQLAFFTGIMPEDGHFKDQSQLFVQVYPYFVEHFNERRYGRIWKDINEFTPGVLKALGKMLGANTKGG